MTSADREKFFRQRVLSKLFPSEEESDSEVDEDTTKQLHSPVGTESEDLHDVACKGQKRKLSVTKVLLQTVVFPFRMKKTRRRTLHSSFIL